jgi:hypothetical protein
MQNGELPDGLLPAAAGAALMAANVPIAVNANKNLCQEPRIASSVSGFKPTSLRQANSAHGFRSNHVRALGAPAIRLNQGSPPAQ